MKVLKENNHPLLTHIAEMREELEEVRAEYERAILEAREFGYSLREIEPYAGVSNVSVLNISKRARQRMEN